VTAGLAVTLPVPTGPTPPSGGIGALWSGIRTVARLELRQRVRSSRWFVVLAIWVIVLGGLTLLVRWAVQRSYELGINPSGVGGDALSQAQIHARDADAGRMIFGIIVFLVLSLGGLVAPALSATSVNGDRSAGVLATLQTTLLTPTQIVLGKLAAAWLVALALLVAAGPFIAWAYLDGGTPVLRLLVVLVILALTLLVVCAVGLGYSALTARTSSSAVLTYLTVALLYLGLPLLFALSLPLVTQTDRMTVSSLEPIDPNDTSTNPALHCVTAVESVSRPHTERSWWLLAASPYVLLADAAPQPEPVATPDITSPDYVPASASDPLSVIRRGVREARLGPSPTDANCANFQQNEQQSSQRSTQRDALGVTWPYGLAANLVLGLLFTLTAIRRLRSPARNLPRGTRVA